MFLVVARHPIDAGWEARDQALAARAGCRWDAGVTDAGSRTLVWKADDFDRALALRWRLELVEGVRVSLRER